MPYDDRPLSEGGNKAINEPEKIGGFSSHAPKGKFRVVGFDSFDGGDWKVGDYKDKSQAIKIANEKSGQMTMMYVFDSKGKRIYSAGKF